MCFALSACSDRESAPITDAVYTASNVHMNNEVISETAEIDALLSSSQNNILDRQTTIFEINPDIIERKDSPYSQEIPRQQISKPQRGKHSLVIYMSTQLFLMTDTRLAL